MPKPVATHRRISFLFGAVPCTIVPTAFIDAMG